MDPVAAIILLVAFALIIASLALPIAALIVSIQTRRKFSRQLSDVNHHGPALHEEIRRLQARIDKLEIALAQQPGATEPRIEITPTPSEPTPIPEPPTPIPQPQPPPQTSEPVPAAPRRAIRADQLESVIGRRWLGWIAIAVILFATAFFLKYAFDNRWIGELGRVSIGVTFGIVFSALGFKYYKRGWRIFSQILLAGGVILLYLSVYAAFGYYHLVNQKAAFIYLAILIAEAAGLALVYEAPAIAIMALIGGFLTPLLLHSDQDQYQSFFAYIIALDIGSLALLKRWRGLNSLAFFGTHVLFWIWYNENFHEQKLVAVAIFQLLVFAIFILAYMGKKFLRREDATIEDRVLLSLNAFTFFTTTYHLLNPQHHDWMGAFAIGMALVYALIAKVLLSRSGTQLVEVLTAIAVSLVFATVAIPIQLKSNWIAIAWSVEAIALLWASMATNSQRLRAASYVLFALAIGKLLFWDTPLNRPPFTPILNQYFLSSLVVIGSLFGAVFLYGAQSSRRENGVLRSVFLVLGIALLWIVMSFETETFFWSRAATQKFPVDASHEYWLGQMALSVVWAIYAAVLAGIGFMRRSSVVRWVGLVLFALTVVKAMLIDIAALQQLYRIIVFFVLGFLLLVVAWGYHKAFKAREALK